MNFKGKCAVKLMHGLPKLETSRNVSSKVIKSSFMVQPQLVKIGGPWTRSMIRLSMDPVHERGSMYPVHILMDPVHGGGPWTRGPCFVLSRFVLTSFLRKVLLRSRSRLVYFAMSTSMPAAGSEIFHRKESFFPCSPLRGKLTKERSSAQFTIAEWTVKVCLLHFRLENM